MFARNLTLILLTLSFAAIAGERGGSAGNGGGALVCRNDFDHVLSIELIDLAEGRVVLGHQHEASVDPLAKIRKASPDFAVLVEEELANTHARLSLTKDREQLEETSDVSTDLKVFDCPVEQLGNYVDETNTLFVDRTLYQRLNTLNLSAFHLHEAIYKIAREKNGATYSDSVRKLVSAAHASNSTTIEIINLIQQIAP